MPHSAQRYKVKLASGRILGPLDLDRVRMLVLKNQIVGTETARAYPKGEWVDINSITEIGEILIARAEGKLAQPDEGYAPILGDPNKTQVLPGARPLLTEAKTLANLRELKTVAAPPETALTHQNVSEDEVTRLVAVNASDTRGAPKTEASLENDGDGEKTVVAPADGQGGGTGSPSGSEDDDQTRIAEPSEPSLQIDSSALADAGLLPNGAGEGLPLEAPAAYDPSQPSYAQGNAKRIAREKTVVFLRSGDGTHATRTGATGGSGPKPKSKIFEALKTLAVAAALGMVGYELMYGAEDAAKAPVRWQPIRPKLPEYIKGNPQPQESAKIYAEAMRDYVQDNVTGYRQAAEKLRRAAAHDIGNVKALAMLASTYLNLIDTSNKDENYFAVISKLIDMSRAKNVDLSETVIADVEFYITVNRAEAAQNRIVEFTKNREIDLSMFHYLGLSFYHRGDFQNAANYLGRIPDNRVFSAKTFYLRGLVAEKLGDMQAAFGQYEKAVKLNSAHAKSRLKIAELLSKRGALKEAAAHLDYLVTHNALLAPKDLGFAYFLHSQLSQLYNKPDVALGDMERAVKLDRENHDYQLELYTLRAKAGDMSIKGVQKEARMYFFLSEGEKVLRFGRFHEALIQFMQSHDANPDSPLPLVKIGDMFRAQNDLNNALVNYRKATQRAKNDIAVWSKYINALIDSYEWEEAKKAMDRFRGMQVPQSAIDKAAADWYAKQGNHAEAQGFYKKAMARDTVDPDVYSAYAKSLMATRNFKEAPFFYALALRFDPLNTDAILGTAKAVAATDSIERAISMLQDELSKSSRASSAILSAIAEFNVQKGDWEQAQQNVDQARVADPEFAAPYRVQAQIHLNKEGIEKDALDKALAAYQSYSERNPSDAQGYLERYNIFLKKLQFERAGEELAKIYALFPKYPKLHFYQGWLFAAQGNHKAAADEYVKELENNPNHVQTLIALGKERIELGQLQTFKTRDGKDVIGAQELLNKAMQVQPQNSEAKHQAGYAAYLLKNYYAAVALYRGALVQDKANPMIHKRLGMAYRDMGDPQAAAEAFRKYLEMEPDAPDKAEFERFR